MEKINEAGAAPRPPTVLPWEEWYGLPVSAKDREEWAQKIASGEGTMSVRSGDTAVRGEIDDYHGEIEITEYQIRKTCSVPLPPDCEWAKWHRLRQAAGDLRDALRAVCQAFAYTAPEHLPSEALLAFEKAAAALAKAEDSPSSLGSAPGDSK